MKQLTPRQNQIYQYILSNGNATNSKIKQHLKELYGNISRITIVRDLEELIGLNFILKKGAGRNTHYSPIKITSLLRYYDPGLYFKQSTDERSIATHFNTSIFKQFLTLFNEKELNHLNTLTTQYKKNKEQLSEDIIQKEIERLTIELSWKSSEIEGNTYSLLDTEVLIKEQKEASGHSKEEAIMIINHKKAIDFTFEHSKNFTNISLRKIEDIHRLLIKDMNVSHGLRNQIVRIVGTQYRPIDNVHQIKESLEKMCKLVNTYDDPFHKALSAITLTSYIQPFVDGNKRSARLTANAILNAFNACPLSYRSVDSVEYKKALLLFYEQNSLQYFKELFINQYEFSVNNYFI